MLRVTAEREAMAAIAARQRALTEVTTFRHLVASRTELETGERAVVPTKVHVTQPIEMRLEEMVIELMSRARDLGRITRGEVVGTLILGP